MWARAALLNQPDLAASVAEAADRSATGNEAIYSRARGSRKKPGGAPISWRRLPLRIFLDCGHLWTAFIRVKLNSPRSITFATIGGAPMLAEFQDHVNYEKQWNQDIKPKDVSIADGLPLSPPEEARPAETEWKIAESTWNSSYQVPATKVLIAWAKTHPNDPQSTGSSALLFPRLTLCLFSGLLAKNDFSHEAFTLLHKNYPHSEWTLKTKYWF